MAGSFSDVSVQLFAADQVPIEILNWVEAIKLLGIEFSLYVVDESDSPAERNSAIVSWLEGSTRKSLIQVNGDILPPIDICRIADSLSDMVHIIGAPYLAQRGGNLELAAVGLTSRPDLLDGEGIVECKWVGRGLMAFDRMTLAKLSSRVGGAYSQQTDEHGMKIYSMDESFGRLARSQGYRIWLNRDYLCGRFFGSILIPLEDGRVSALPRSRLWNGRQFPTLLTQAKPVARLIAQALQITGCETIMGSHRETLAARTLLEEMTRLRFCASLNLSDCGECVAPSYLLALLGVLEKDSPKRILDIGSGETTRLFNAYCENNNAYCYVLEENPLFAQRLTDLSHVDIDVRLIGDDGWYDGVRTAEPYDLISVDGPQGVNRNRIASRITELATTRSIVFLDDSGRPDIDSLATALCNKMGFRREDLYGSRRFSVLRR